MRRLRGSHCSALTDLRQRLNRLPYARDVTDVRRVLSLRETAIMVFSETGEREWGVRTGAGGPDVEQGTKERVKTRFRAAARRLRSSGSESR